MTTPSGKLIVLEGIDGSGKTTLQRGIAARLGALGARVVTTKEPTDGPLGQQIRALARSGREGVSKEEELSLFHEDRKVHVETVVLPALASGAIVVQDRSYFSTVAYQGERGFDRAALLALERAIAPDPDLLLVVDVPAELALERIHTARALAADDFERLETLQRIRRVFLELPGAVVLDGRLTEHALLDRAMNVISKRLSLPAAIS
ncbi:MAG TPA: dTMP kinase [Myxococcota bacterium]|nr:dTMP kinase [Myxococcota bacterium]